MASFLKRVSTSCSNTRACSGPTNVRKKPFERRVAERRTEYDSLSLQSAGPNEIHLAVVSTLLNNLVREPVSRDWPLVCLELLARCPEAEDRQETAKLAARETPEGVARLSDWASP